MSCLCFGSSDPTLQGFTNADYASDIDCRKSTFGYPMTYVEETCHGNQDCGNMFLCQLEKSKYIVAVDGLY